MSSSRIFSALAAVSLALCGCALLGMYDIDSGGPGATGGAPSGGGSTGGGGALSGGAPSGGASGVGAGGTGSTGGSACIASIAVGGLHSCLRKADGTLWCWGLNDVGQLGDGTTSGQQQCYPMSCKPTPVKVDSLGGDVALVALGGSHSCALKTDGTLWCWGDNDNGQLGDGTTAGKALPVQVTSLGGKVAEVALGSDHSCARQNDGTLWCWGLNGAGQLGDGTTSGQACYLSAACKPTPVQVKALGNTVTSVAVGGGHACARRSDGTLWCWGYNAAGQLGDGTTATPKPSPVQVAQLGANVVEVALGLYHSCARKADGTLWCWGSNDLGQSGTETSTPTKVASLSASVASVALGAYHSCARKTDGTLWCWGWNESGQLGDGTSGATPKSIPVQVSSLGGGVADVALGGHSCALKADGTLWCWGPNGSGQLGDGTWGLTSEKSTPVQAQVPCP